MAATVQHVYNSASRVYAPGDVIEVAVVVTQDDPEPITGTIKTTTTITFPDGMVSQPIVTESEYVVDGKPGRATTTLTTDSTGRTWERIVFEDSRSVFRTAA